MAKDDDGTDGATPPPVSTPPPSDTTKTTTWKLPEGIEDDLAKGVVEAGIGMAAGGLLGALLFRSGSGWRSASVAAGFGIALGSSFERIRGKY